MNRRLVSVSIVAALLVAGSALAQQLPSPGVDRKTAVAVALAPTANYFELAHFDTSNRPDGVVVDVWWNAYTKAEDGAKVLVKNMGPVTVQGAALVTIGADALARAKRYESGGQPAGIAYMLGQRDAIYAVLQSTGNIPAEAK